MFSPPFLTEIPKENPGEILGQRFRTTVYTLRRAVLRSTAVGAIFFETETADREAAVLFSAKETFNRKKGERMLLPDIKTCLASAWDIRCFFASIFKAKLRAFGDLLSDGEKEFFYLLQFSFGPRSRGFELVFASLVCMLILASYISGILRHN